MSTEELGERALALEIALTRGGAELDADAAARASAVVQKIRERTALTGDFTVVALAGATGSGKSSLFNALVGAPVATVGVRRPTTSTPTAAVWGEADASALLDWLAVGSRHHLDSGTVEKTAGVLVEGAAGGHAGGTVGRPSGRAADVRAEGDRRGAGGTGTSEAGAVGALDGLVLLDLPDVDSRDLRHRAEAERVLELADVFVWVTDPQKYADARLHDDFVAALATHDAVSVVVLNQVDRLTPEQATECAGDLHRLLRADGLHDVTLFSTSATQGTGVDELRQRLANAVAGRGAARMRLAADVSAAAAALLPDVADLDGASVDSAGHGLGGAGHGPGVDGAGRERLVDALVRAAGIPTVVAAVERDYVHEALGRTGWPFTRWARSLRPRPLRRLRLEQVPEVSQADVLAVTGRSSLPPPTPAARAAVDLATRQLGDTAAAGLPVRWAEAVHDAAAPPGPDVADALDQAIVRTPLREPPPRWWAFVNAAHVVLAVAAVVGLAWLVVLAVMGWLQLPDVHTPHLGWFPVPTVLLVGGLILGLLLSTLSRWLARIGARRRAHRVERRLRSAVTEVADDRIVAPVEAVLARHAETRTALARARALPRG
ncbi:putative ABC transporter [Nostocoides japonicum T1-X7]|uniref:Putative ABC transporter n=1 Tax=Nostocoides japonicum T1-X7 TaxID=1194083 RepID=A0A077LZU8_9MICO|nr:GTPase [Tetrasphaera japonica]CCH77500.1 putative ABC transporter [Tetrasphaera japonica T1-X7]